MSQRVAVAQKFAEKAHAGQVRKYTSEPYIVHPIAVSMLVQIAGGTEDMIVAALLHDVVEDCGVPLHTIDMNFGPHVMNLVYNLTNPVSADNRATRHAAIVARYAASSSEVATIKLADIVDNVPSIIKHDPDFAKVYMAEKRLLIRHLKHGNKQLWTRANQLVLDYFEGEKDAGNAGL